MNTKTRRAIVSVIVFAAVYLLAGLIIRWQAYDAYLEALKVLTAVIGAGCYWIGSNE